MKKRFIRDAEALLARVSMSALAVLAFGICLIALIVRACPFVGVDEAGAPSAPSPAESGVFVRVCFHARDEAALMPLEEYIKGVVAGEMPASFELEALKAQAVAARTFTVRRMAELGGEPCGKRGASVCTDSTCCQAYKTEAQLRERWGEGYEYYMEKIEAAVYGTAGLVATYDGEPIEALYHSASGGMTEDAKNVFGGDAPYLVSVASFGDVAAERREGSVSFTRAEFAKIANEKLAAGVSEKSLEDEVRVLSRFESGRVERVRVGDATATGREFRRAFELDSANFTLKFGKKNVTVTTLGYGHGVGMSQHGANAMAKAGSGFSDILRYYYSGASIVALSSLAASLPEH